MKKLFHHTTPEEDVRKWTRQLRSEQRKMDMQITKIQREEQKVKVSMKQAAKKNDTFAVKMLAKELLRSRKAVNRMHTAKAQMNSVGMQLQNQLATIKLSGGLAKSGVIMKDMNDLLKVKEVQETMREMSKEMTKTGIIEEMMNDTLDNALDEDISDGELEDEVSKVVAEVTQNTMQGAHVGTSRIPQQQQLQQPEEVAEEEDYDDLMDRFNALRS
ncbi:charged multivesicular body protein 3 [Strigomonas culicis]|uniref:Charged multivesicular body protein 3 n=1 Tax=Strigomonas culicis TaxID=28005 RepID=S9UP17_9TRYP|nr:charged multivesicular body protein 3 [Strigomonas culicis]|eukprot:EPY30658.1 charged multivesicular body protein 3 [Strigomonas culicis]